jgi:hypothetical protein
MSTFCWSNEFEREHKDEVQTKVHIGGTYSFQITMNNRRIMSMQMFETTSNFIQLDQTHDSLDNRSLA